MRTKHCVLRGGSWSSKAKHLCSERKVTYPRTELYGNFGFRLVRILTNLNFPIRKGFEMTFLKIPDQSYEMQDTLVTQKEWTEVMGKNPSYFKGNENNPVEQVSWNDVQKFIKKMNDKKDGYIYRLPTEEEWAFCAKSCDSQNIDEIAWHWENSNQTTHPVKTKKPNDLGLYDMLGNCWEWMQDEWK